MLELEKQQEIQWITFNRVEKHNAFNADFLRALHTAVCEAEKDKAIRVIVIKAHGKHFSAGADLDWMQQMSTFSEQENQADALILAKTMHAIYTSKKPVMAMVHGMSMGGGAGLLATCDMVIAADSAQFCFSEVRLGLIPAVISPYVVQAIGARAATRLFMSAETIDAQEAHQLQLVTHCVPMCELLPTTERLIALILAAAPDAVCESKALVRTVKDKPIDVALSTYTADLIAKKRGSPEGKKGLTAFLNKTKPNW